MFFLLRTAFWLTIILAVLPVFVTHESPATRDAPKFSAGDAVSAATAAMADLGQFCTRRPEACETGFQAAAAIGASAQTGVKILYGYLQGRTAADAEPAITRTGTVNPRKSAHAKPPGGVSPGSQHTLSASDLGPEWRSPRANQASGA